MSEQHTRSAANYFGKSFSYLDPVTDDHITLFTILSGFSFYGQKASFAFDTWGDAAQFDNYSAPILQRRVNFQTEITEIFDMLNSGAVRFLIASDAENWRLNLLMIDLNQKQINISVAHKTIPHKTLSQVLDTPGQFDELIATHPEIVGAIIQFAWAFGQANNKFLSRFN